LSRWSRRIVNRSWIAVFLSRWRRRIVTDRRRIVNRSWITILLPRWRRRIVSRGRRLINLWSRTVRRRRFVDYRRRSNAVRSGYDLRRCNNLMMLVNMLDWSWWKSCRYRK
jgi:hypothetical protein